MSLIVTGTKRVLVGYGVMAAVGVMFGLLLFIVYQLAGLFIAGMNLVWAAIGVLGLWILTLLAYFIGDILIK